MKVHRKCAVRANNNCKWTTIQSLKREDNDFDDSDPVSLSSNMSCAMVLNPVVVVRSGSGA